MIFWDTSNKALDLSWWGSKEDGTKVGRRFPKWIVCGQPPLKVACIAQVGLWENINPADSWRIWKLIPVPGEGSAGLNAKKDEGPPEYSEK